MGDTPSGAKLDVREKDKKGTTQTKKRGGGLKSAEGEIQTAGLSGPIERVDGVVPKQRSEDVQIGLKQIRTHSPETSLLTWSCN